ncbi:hypothetical protein D9613_012342 [Agrocybe pediades]|uniref:Uncharacterized protein n=1 Tax=Agrocybe pediades TaxID=84607 RepID=A0A8H4QEU6_9AGAR|nr:hypothetical protein D9613_012342 [Agrocybe pediades]
MVLTRSGKGAVVDQDTQMASPVTSPRRARRVPREVAAKPKPDPVVASPRLRKTPRARTKEQKAMSPFIVEVENPYPVDVPAPVMRHRFETPAIATSGPPTVPPPVREVFRAPPQRIVAQDMSFYEVMVPREVLVQLTEQKLNPPILMMGRDRSLTPVPYHEQIRFPTPFAPQPVDTVTPTPEDPLGPAIVYNPPTHADVHTPVQNAIFAAPSGIPTPSPEKAGRKNPGRRTK